MAPRYNKNLSPEQELFETLLTFAEWKIEQGEPEKAQRAIDKAKVIIENVREREKTLRIIHQ